MTVLEFVNQHQDFDFTNGEIVIYDKTDGKHGIFQANGDAGSRVLVAACPCNDWPMPGTMRCSDLASIMQTNDEVAARAVHQWASIKRVAAWSHTKRVLHLIV